MAAAARKSVGELFPTRTIVVGHASPGQLGAKHGLGARVVLGIGGSTRYRYTIEFVGSKCDEPVEPRFL